MSATVVQLESYTGEWWTLHGIGQGDRGVVLNEIEGIIDAPVKTDWTQTAFRPGSSPGGVRWDARDVRFTVTIAGALQHGKAPQDWERLDSQFRQAWSYSEDSRLWVETPTSRRHLALRPIEAPHTLTARDPRRNHLAQVEMTCRAGVPWWIEADVIDTWVSQAAGVGSGTVTVSNPTDRPMWLKWVISAPGTWTLPDYSWFGSPTFSAGDLPADIADRAATSTARKIVMPTLASGPAVDIDTDPFEEQVVRAGYPNFWALMNGLQFLFPVPPWTPQTALPVKVDGPVGSTVLVMCERQWTRAWGMH
ncbi:phage tail protein [Nocardia sp. NPDC052566]|uniref:phage tail protein n=1 Tax=Nocardia sp. NPDC052566 TaxID=3364330 RepID=UPI0037C82D95